MRELVGDLETGLATTVQATALVFGAIGILRFVWMYPATYLARLFPNDAGDDTAHQVVGGPTADTAGRASAGGRLPGEGASDRRVKA